MAEPRGVTDTLRELVAEIAVGDYRDPHGHRLTLNTAFLRARTLLQVADLLEQPAPSARSAGEDDGSKESP